MMSFWKRLTLPPSMAVLLLMMPLAVYAAIEGIGGILLAAPANWTIQNVLATGIISVAIAVVCLFRFWTGEEKKTQQELNSELHMRNSAQQVVPQKRTQPGRGDQQYPQIYFTATRPCSVNVKPMLMLSNEIQSFVERIDQYTDSLEAILSQRIAELNTAKTQLDGLLQQLLPPSIAQRFSAGEKVAPASFDCVTVYLCDIVGYTTIVAQSTAVEMVEFLNGLYRMTDAIVLNYDAYKVETIGDADLIASGIPLPNGNKHATEMAKLSLHMMTAFLGFRIPHRPSETLRVRIGLHSGHCMAGIVGSKIPKYCLFGDAVSTAAKMEATSEPARIQISHTTAEILRTTGGFALESRGPIQLKGKKNFETYWLNGEENA